MQPEHFYFGGGSSETVIHPAVAVLMMLTIVLILILPRQKIIAPFFLITFLIPLGQTLVIGGLHLFVLRIVLLFACIRMVWTKLSTQTNLFSGGFGYLDKAFTLWAIFRAAAFLILFTFRSEAIINQGAFLLDAFGAYFFLRYLIQDVDDIRRAVKIFAAIAIVLALLMLDEKLHNQNLLGYLSVGHPTVPQMRDGAIRAQGPFLHPILAGSFGATLLPLFFWLWQSGESKVLAVAGAISSTCIILSSASSTPMMAYGAGIVGVCFWPMRNHMRAFRWALTSVLVTLHLIMKAPVWFLIARVDLTGASSGFHRAELVDTFIRHFSEWWLIGTNNNASWGFDMWDVSNQFVAEGVTGGLATFVCFMALITISFSKLGTARKSVEGDRKQEWFLWFLGCALLSHLVAYFGISYFDHTQVAWFALLAMIAAATATVTVPQETTRPERKPANAHFSLSPAPVTGVQRMEMDRPLAEPSRRN